MKKKILAVALSTLMVCTMTAALYACGGEDTGTYTVTYAYSGLGETGTLPTDENKYKKGDEVTLKAANFLDLTNYHFMGWNDGTKTYKVSEKYTMPAKNVTLTAEWQLNGYTVSFSNSRADSSATVVLEDEYQAGAEITLIAKPDNFTDENNRVFSGWYNVQNEQPVYYEVGDTFEIPDHDVTFYAYWKATSITVSFYLDQSINGAKYTTKTYEFDETITLPENPADRTVNGKVYEFAGWYRHDNEDIPFTTATTFSEQEKDYGAISVFAKWNEKIDEQGGGDKQEDTYKIHYALGNKSSRYTEIRSVEYKAGDEVTVITMTDEEIALYGEITRWTYFIISDDGEEEFFYNAGETFTMPARDITLTAVEESNAIPVYFFIDIDATWFDPSQVVEGEEPWLTIIEVEPDGFAGMTLPDINSFELGQYATGYTFAGWFYPDADDNYNTIDVPFNTNYVLNEDHIDDAMGGLYVYAMWTPISAE
ncbi:MAG: InlB B-repeat-containing protein [Clostridia bacterium]|nr:InlB B-repeat-containing protein [Clostridia bacterium]